MKKWIKRHSRGIAIAAEVCMLGVISYVLYWYAAKGNALLFSINVINFVIWLVLLLWTTGIAGKIYTWWQKD